MDYSGPGGKEEEKGLTEYEKIVKWVDEKSNAKTESRTTTQSPSIFEVPSKLLNVRKSAFHPEIFYLGLLFKGDFYWRFKQLHIGRFFREKFEDISKSSSNSDKVDDSKEKVRKDKAPKDESESSSNSDNVDDLKEKVRKYEALKDKFLRDMINLVEKTTYCYDEPTRGRFALNVFFKAMVTDGYYLVRLLPLCNEITKNDTEERVLDESILVARWQLSSLARDLIKLQNQLPFFLLQELFSMTAPGKDESYLRDQFMTFFCTKLKLNERIYQLDPSPTRKYAHPLDLCRSLFIYPIQQQQPHLKMEYSKLMYSAQELKEAGIKFVRREQSNLLNINFDLNNGVLQIPPLSIDENMIVALLNFVAYEQCDHSQKPYFTNYLLFLDSLINITTDIEILRKSGVISYPLGTEKEVVSLFNNFCKEMVHSFDQAYLAVDMDAVNRHCKAFYDCPVRVGWSNFIKEKFSNFWTPLALVGSILLLVLTTLQTIYTILAYHRQN